MRTWLFSVIVLLPLSLLAQASHVFVDGFTSDWSACTHKYSDEAGDGNTIDLLQLRAMNDEDYLFIAFRTYEEFQLSQDNTLTLLLDTDGDASTGFQFNGIGAELKWDFGRRRGTFYYNGGSASVRHDDFGFLALPTVTAKEFEMAFNRHAKPDGTHALFTTSSVRVVIYDNQQPGDIMPEAGSFFTYPFDNSQLPAVQPISIARDNANYLRLMTWNMLQDGIADPTRSESFERVLQAISPDIITFNEAWDTEASAVKSILNSILPLPGGASWQAHKLVSGNITASRYPIKQSYDVVPGKRLSAHLIDLPDATFNHDLVVFNCHLKCCNSDGDNETRQYEVNGLMTFVNKMKAGFSSFSVEANTPFVFMGDMNLVGTSENLATMLNGIDGQKPDWDSSPMDDDIARNATINAAYTYAEEGTSYWPGRLDYILYTGSEMKVQKSFVFQSSLMSDEELDLLGVYRTDNATASDHLPHVADFTIEKTSGVENTIKASKIGIYPQPANDFVTVEGIDKKQYRSFKVYDLFGVNNLSGTIDDSASELKIDIRTLKTGLYFVSFFSENGKTVLRMLVNH